MNLGLNNKIIVVSGGAKGIGLGICEVLASEGAVPVIIGRNKKDNLEAVKKLKKLGAKAHHLVAELTKPEACKAAINQVVKKYKRIDGLVNNAGVNDGVGLQNGDYKKFMASLHKNLVHYYLLAQHSLPYLIQSKGAIVNISSKTADTGQGGTSAYAASNGGRNALTREWAVELLPYSIRVNAVVVAESYTPLYEKWISSFDNPTEKLQSISNKIPFEKRMTTPEEIGNTVAFLLSGKSSHTTGQIVYVDGGYVHLDRALS
ncbi:MAG: SDR family oxidoreductase [Ferruginibacter sp.]